mmetsp:Transcript_48509/g.135590  ORF Transcript_48509/g.135590 Transcript_48509/m.135590 type:complete len:220 (+) Transcript_48509:263-922(+)
MRPSLLTSIRETTPRVTQMFSPPTGKPMHVTLSSSRGNSSESSSDSFPRQKSPSTSKAARSHGKPRAATRALYLMGGPVVALTSTDTARCTTCAFVTIHLPPMRKPVPVHDCWLCLRQGSAKFARTFFTKSLHTEPVPAETPRPTISGTVAPPATPLRAEVMRNLLAFRGKSNAASSEAAPESLSAMCVHLPADTTGWLGRSAQRQRCLRAPRPSPLII